MTELARELEDLGRQGSLNQAETILDKLKSEFEFVKLELAKHTPSPVQTPANPGSSARLKANEEALVSRG